MQMCLVPMGQHRAETGTNRGSHPVQMPVFLAVAVLALGPATVDVAHSETKLSIRCLTGYCVVKASTVGDGTRLEGVHEFDKVHLVQALKSVVARSRAVVWSIGLELEYMYRTNRASGTGPGRGK